MSRSKATRTQICENFFAHVDQRGGPDSCWPFLRCKNRKGYGRVWVEKKCWEAHRFAYSLACGPIPDGLCVLHNCDNPSCCNPSHLRVGTAFDNAMDRETRHRGNQPKGENNSQAKLSTRDILFIRRCRDIYNTYEMAKMLDVEPAIISKILRGEQWAHVQDFVALKA